MPKESKGGVFAPADMKLIKEALTAYMWELLDTDPKYKQLANLLHRINRI